MYIKKTARLEQAERTRQHIYESAMALFNQKGFENATVEEVAEAAGLSVGAFYHHFKSKQEIFARFHISQDIRYQSFYDIYIATGLHADKSALEKLGFFTRFTVEACVDLGLGHVRVVYPYMLTDEGFGDEIASTGRIYYQLMYHLVAEARRLGQILSPLPDRQIVNDLTVIARGCIVDWCINSGKKDVREVCGTVVDLYLAGIST